MSSKPGVQRFKHFNAPLHKRHDMFSASLSKDLRLKYMRRSIPVKKGDVVRVLRGDFVGKEGKVTLVVSSKIRIHVEGVTREKADGTQIHLPIHPSNVMITRLNTDDKWRRQRLGRTTEAIVEEKPSAEEAPK